MRGGYDGSVGLPVSLLLIAVGAILAFAVTAQTSGIDIQTVGWILIAVGLLGVLLSLIMWDTWAGPGYWRRSRPGPPPPQPPRRY